MVARSLLIFLRGGNSNRPADYLVYAESDAILAL